MKTLFISADMEGCAAVAAQHALAPDRFEWRDARRWMTLEVVAVAEAAKASGYQSVIVADGHGNAHNIEPELVPDDVWLVRSWPRPLLQMQGAENENVVACAFVGYHAGGTAEGAILAHAYFGRAFRRVRLNGEDCSEGYFNAAVAGEMGRPIVFVSGDRGTIADAARYAPDASTFLAKETIGWRSMMSLPPSQIQRAIKDAARHAFNKPLPAPFQLQGPYELELEMTSQVSAEMLSYLPGIERCSAWAVRARFDRLDAAMKFMACAMLYSPMGEPAL
jgi:D-amino peptidase